jgi:hypothetical protein
MIRIVLYRQASQSVSETRKKINRECTIDRHRNAQQWRYEEVALHANIIQEPRDKQQSKGLRSEIPRMEKITVPSNT